MPGFVSSESSASFRARLCEYICQDPSRKQTAPSKEVTKKCLERGLFVKAGGRGYGKPTGGVKHNGSLSYLMVRRDEGR